MNSFTARYEFRLFTGNRPVFLIGQSITLLRLRILITKAGIQPITEACLMARSFFRLSRDGTNFSLPPILVVPNKGFLLLGAVLIAGGFDGVFERSVDDERGVLLLDWNHF